MHLLGCLEHGHPVLHVNSGMGTAERGGSHHSASWNYSQLCLVPGGLFGLGPVYRQRLVREGKAVVCASRWKPLETSSPSFGAAPALKLLTVCSELLNPSDQLEELYKMQVPGLLSSLLNPNLRAGALESVFFQSRET